MVKLVLKMMMNILSLILFCKIDQLKIASLFSYSRVEKYFLKRNKQTDVYKENGDNKVEIIYLLVYNRSKLQQIIAMTKL